MKVLIATHAGHIPKPGGGQEDIYAFAELLIAAGHEVRLLTVHRPQQKPEALDYVRNRLRVPVVAIDPGTGTAAEWLSACLRERALLERTSWLAHRVTRTREYAELMRAYAPALVVGFFSHTWPFLRDARRRGISTVFRSQDFIPTFTLETFGALQRLNPVSWVRFLAQRRCERLACEHAGAVATLPLAEERLYAKWCGRPVFTFTLAYLADWVRPPTFHAGKRPLDVFYFGASYNVLLHLRGVEFLLEKIIPAARRKAPDAFRFNITGAKLPERLKALCDGKTVIYHDYVPDLRQFLEGMDVGLAPVDTGKSLKGKVFAPISSGFPMVIAPNCVSLQPLEDGKHVLIAKTAEEYADAMVKLLDDGAREHVGQAAYEWSAARHSKEKLLELLARVIDAAQR